MGVIEARRRILLSAPHPVTTTPAPVASFNTDMVGKLRSAKFGFLPVQSGSGDPSPTNVRPISGWDGLTVTRCGKNVLGEIESGGFDGSGKNISSGTRVRTRGYIPVVPGDKYTISGIPAVSGKTAQASTSYYSVADFSTARIGNGNWENLPATFTMPNGAKYMRILFRYTDDASVTTASFDELMAEPGQAATAYAPYTGSTYPVSWQSAGTIYGGYVDVVKGVVVAEWANVDLGTLSWNYNSTGKVFVSSAINTKSNTGFGNKPNLLCPIYWTTESNSFYGWSFIEGDKWISLLYDAPWVIVRDYAYNGDVTAFKTAMSGISIVFALATPITYALTPQIIKSLRGANNMWSTGNGDTTITYWTH